MKVILYGSVCGVLASLLVQPAWAQTARTGDPTVASASQASPSPSERSGTIEEIVVTAQRFNESAQKTSLAITVLDSAKLQGVTDVQRLQTIDPGIRFGQAGNVIQTFVRGVGSYNGTSSQEGAVAYNADGVFMFTSTMTSPLFYDLERVEILKGPQGTLYGRNASGGAVNIITRGPTLGKAEGYLEGEYGNYDQVRVAGAVNAPLADTLAVRVAGQHVQHDGYLSDGTDDQDQTSGRLRLLWEPSSAVTLRVGVDGSSVDSVGGGTTINPNPTGDKFLGGLDPRAQTGPVYLGGTSLLSTPPNPEPYFKDHQWGASGQLDLDMGFATLTLLPAYRYEDLDYRDYTGGYEAVQKFKTKQKSFESRLSNRNDKVKWVLGAYYFKVNQQGLVHIRNDAAFQNSEIINPTWVESYAFFGETTYSIAPSLRVIGGLRYTKEKTHSSGSANAQVGLPTLPTPQTAAFNPYDPVTNPSGELLDYYISGRSSADAVTWKVGVEGDLSAHSMLFATASRGFKGGGTYADVPGVNTSFNPEYLTAFEFGSRNRFFGNTLQFNAEVFYWKLKDQQIPFVGFDPVGQVTLVTLNAGKAHMYGASVDAVWKPTSSDTFSLGVQYEHSEYDSFTRTVPSLSVLTSTRCAVSGYDPTPGSLTPAVVDCAGQPLLRAPKWSGSASYEHRFDLGDHGELAAEADTTLASDSYLDAGYTSLYQQKAYALLNASLTWRSPSGALSVTGWAKNITNEVIYTGGIQSYDFYSRPTVLPPRTYGATMRYAF